MLKKLKLIASLLLISCLFLPLSTCTTQPHPQAADQTVEVTERYALILNDNGAHANTPFIQRYGAGLLFLLPFIFALAALFRAQDNLFYNLIEIIAGLAALFVVAVHNFTGELAIGGYLALLGGLSYTLMAGALFFQGLAHRFSKRPKA